MNNQIKSLLKKCGILAVFGIIFAGGYFQSHFGQINTKQDLYRILADAFTVPGVLMVCVGLLIIMSNHGVLDGLTYGLSYMFTRLNPFSKKKLQMEYYDYVQFKRANRLTGISFTFITGCVFMAITIVFLVLYSIQ